MLLTYKQTITTAFQQVSDCLIAYQRYREYRQQQQLLTDATQTTEDLSNTLYENGGASYL